MATIDHSIYFQQQAPDVMGSIQKGLSMRDMLDERKLKQAQQLEQKALKDSFRGGMNPDGSFDQAKVMSNLVSNPNANPMKAYELKTQFDQQSRQSEKAKLEEYMTKNSLAAQYIGAARDQQTYDQVVPELVRMGVVKPGELPAQFHPDTVKFIQGKALTTQQQLEQMWKQRGFDQKERELNYKREENKLKSTGDLSKAAMDLRKERSSLQTTKDTAQVAAAYNRIQSSAEKPSAAGDLSLIFNYMKMLDPGSVVRESEFRSAEQARAWVSRAEGSGIMVPANVKQSIQKLESGQFLLPEQRRDFVNRAGGLWQSQMDLQNQVDSQFAELAQSAGVDPKQVILDVRANKAKTKNKDPLSDLSDDEVDRLYREAGGQ